MGARRLDLGYPTEVTTTGDGPLVVLVHGTPLDAGAWREVVPRLADGRRVVTYDLRGHGSARATALPASYDVLAADLLRLLDGLGAASAHVVGHSFGGQVAQAATFAAPERVASLWNVCARLTPFPAFAEAAARVDAGRLADIAARTLRRWFTPAQIAADGPPVRYARAALENAVAATLATALRMIAAFDATPQLAALGMPVRMIAAERDAVATPDDLRAGARHVPDGAFALVPGAGHLLPLEQPGRLVPLLSDLPRR